MMTTWPRETTHVCMYNQCVCVCICVYVCVCVCVRGPVTCNLRNSEPLGSYAAAGRVHPWYAADCVLKARSAYISSLSSAFLLRC